MNLLTRLSPLAPFITEILNISGVPGLSLGVLHNSTTTYTHNFGLQDTTTQLPPNENTTFVIGSLTKALTASLLGILVSEQKLNWTTPLGAVLPEFTRAEPTDPRRNLTIEDLLTHRTGLPRYDEYWLRSSAEIPLSRSEAAKILSSIPPVVEFRTEWHYNNLAYEILGQVVEAVSGARYADFLWERITQPLGLTRTFFAEDPEENAAVPYASLRDATVVEIPRPLVGEQVFVGAAGAVRSCVRDLLVLYRAMMEAGMAEYGQGSGGGSSVGTRGKEEEGKVNPFKKVPDLWQAGISMPWKPSLREYSYAKGWMRAELPGYLQFDAPGGGGLPMLGHGLPSRLVLHHTGSIPGYAAYVALFPESMDAVVVLANSMGLTNARRVVGEMLVEGLFQSGHEINGSEYVEQTRRMAKEGADFMAGLAEEMRRDTVVDKPVRPLKEYVGRYYNGLGNWFIDVLEVEGKLLVSFFGLEADTWELHPYREDSFHWLMEHDVAAKAARVTVYPKEYYIISFGCGTDGEEDGETGIERLVWKHEVAVEGLGEVFRRDKGFRGHYEQEENWALEEL